MTKQKSIEFKNYQLTTLFQILNVPLHGAESRARSKFIELLQKQIEMNEKSRLEILTKYAEKDEKGKLKIIDGTNSYDITPENTTKFNEEYVVLQGESFIVDLLPSTLAYIQTISNLVLNTKVEFALPEGRVYSELCDIFESIK